MNKFIVLCEITVIILKRFQCSGATCIGTADAVGGEASCGSTTNNIATGVCGACQLSADGTGGPGAASTATATGASTCSTGLACCADGSCITDNTACP